MICLYGNGLATMPAGAHWTDAVDWTWGAWRRWVEKHGATMQEQNTDG